MSISSASGSQMVDMNVTPLVDVMLVLLIIFMVTVPAISHPLQLDLPQRGPTPKTSVPLDPVRIQVLASSTLSWNGYPVSMQELAARFDALRAASVSSGVADVSRQPLVKIEASPEAEYDGIAKVLARARNADLTKISLVEPNSAE